MTRRKQKGDLTTENAEGIAECGMGKSPNPFQLFTTEDAENAEDEKLIFFLLRLFSLWFISS